MLQALARPSTVRLADGRVLIMGGTVPFAGKCEMACLNDSNTASVEVYDATSRKFGNAGSLAQPRAGGIALPLPDGRVLLYGELMYGSAAGTFDGSEDTMEIYDPATKTSAEVRPPNGMQLPSDAAVVLIAGRRVLIAGGSYDLCSTSNVTWIFDPASGSFSKAPLMAESREDATSTLLPDGSVLIVGGENLEGCDFSESDSAEVIKPLDPLSKSTLVSSADSGLGDPATSTLLSDGRVLVTEGRTQCDPDTCVPTIPEVFDPRTGRFTLTGPMVTPRTSSAAVALPDGRALVFGGVDAKGAVAGTIEAFDPYSDTFQVVAKGFPELTEFSVTLLKDGQVLIAGGHDGQGHETAATWLLKP
jgi:hypothetical protein